MKKLSALNIILFVVLWVVSGLIVPGVFLERLLLGLLIAVAFYMTGPGIEVAKLKDYPRILSILVVVSCLLFFFCVARVIEEEPLARRIPAAVLGIVFAIIHRIVVKKCRDANQEKTDTIRDLD